MLKKILICVTVVLNGPLVWGQGEKDAAAGVTITIGEKFSLHSAILDEERAYWVYLPASYDNAASRSRHYPVLYILDGDWHFQSATGVVQFMSSGINGNRQIPELIVVAIPNTNRTRDLTPTHTLNGYDGTTTESLAVSGGGDNFLRFIEDELFTIVDSQYRTLPHRTLVGHSLGGLMAMHALLAAPEMFQAYIAIDPSMWWDDQALTARAERIFAKPDARRGSVYISQAHPLNIGDGDPNLMRDSSSAFAAVLANAETPAFRTELQYFADENHGSVPLISLYRGLLHVFDGYNMPLETVVEDPTAVSGHFERISKRLGIKLLPPESVVNDLGYFLLRQIEDPDGAIVLFELNVANYPESANVYDSLGEAYAAADNMQRAIESYEKSLSLDPDNENAANRLEELRKPAVPDQQGTQ